MAMHPGSLIIAGFAGLSPPPEVLARLRAGQLAGVILFGRNFESPLSLTQARGLCAAVHAAAPAGGPPVIVSIDQEGGRVQRLKAPLTVWPPMGRLAGPGKDPALAREVGRALGLELRAVGVNLNYAPVLDVHTNPQNPIIGDRAFGADPAEACARALAFLEGLEGAGVRGCGKHFPGHGDTAQDSHLTLPRVDHDRRRLREVELLPFAEAARRGVGMFMTAHVVYPAVDGLPATLSRRWLVDVLRGELGFEGVILSDDLDMRAVADRDVGDVIVESLLAGCDAFLLCNDAARWARAEEALCQAAERDARVRERVAESAARLARFRAKLAVGRDEAIALPSPAHQALAAGLG
jgi:beta-N-acetylhexosaminidase